MIKTSHVKVRHSSMKVKPQIIPLNPYSMMKHCGGKSRLMFKNKHLKVTLQKHQNLPYQNHHTQPKNTKIAPFIKKTI